jgi:hypothetical protein
MRWYQSSFGARLYLASVLPFPIITPATFFFGLYLFFNQHVIRLFAIPAGICGLLAAYVIARCLLTKVAVDGTTVHVWNPSGRVSINLRPGVELSADPSNFSTNKGLLMVITQPAEQPDGHPRKTRLMVTPGLSQQDYRALRLELSDAARKTGATLADHW